MSFSSILLTVLTTLGLLILAYQLVFRILRWFIRRREKHFYEHERMVMLRMKVPKEDEEDPTKKGPIVMEQIFNTLYGTYKPISLWQRIIVGRALPKMSFEIANVDSQIYFYAYVPKMYQKLIEGQMYAQYAEVEIEVVDDPITAAVEIGREPVKNTFSRGLGDPPIAELRADAARSADGRPAQRVAKSSQKSIFHLVPKGEPHHTLTFEKAEPGIVAVAELGLHHPMLWPFKTYDFFVDKDDKTQVDTLSSITSTISKLNHDEDQAWFQMVIRPMRPLWQKYAIDIFEFFKEGYFNRWDWLMMAMTKWYASPYVLHHWLVKVPTTFLLKIVWKMFGLLKPIETPSVLEKQEVGFSFWEIPDKKLTKIAFETTIRVGYLSRAGAGAAGAAEARLKVEEMASSFNQFHWAEVNGLEIHAIGDTTTPEGKKLFRALQHRELHPGMVLAVDELATLYHLPMRSLETPNVAWVRAKRLEPPPELPTPKEFPDITILGKTNFRGHQKIFGIKPDDQRRHMYIIGKTGMGKSTVLENMIYDDIQKGKGVAVVDPHGEVADKVLSMIPQHRVNDAVIFDPSDTEHPVSFNMLEVKSPEHRPLVASGLVGVFKKLYAESWGPRLEYILRNCILALCEFEGATLLGIPRLLVDPFYREKVVERVTDPVVKAFWKDEFSNMSDKLRTEAISPIQNKVGQFLSSPVIRNILGQVKSSIDIRFAMDTGKIFVVNLSKGKIGEDNSSLLGSMLITKFQLDAMSRADMAPEDRKDFYLYVDEFQNFATDSFATILSEARKYKLNLVMANQYVEQMEEEVMFAVFGNVGSLICFQVGFDDAEYFSKQFGEVVMPADIISLPKYTTYIRLLVDNMPTPVFSAVMNPPVEVDMDSPVRHKVIKASRERYGSDKKIVEEKIMKWSEQLVAPEMKKALAAKSGGMGGAGVRWRYDRNKAEFEDLVNSAGKKFKVLDRKDFEKYDVKDTVNEYVYQLPEENLIVYSRIDNQGNSFNRKENKIVVMKYDAKDPKKQELVGEAEKAPGWQLGMNKLIGGGFRSPKNKEEMEGIFAKSDFSFKEVPRKDFPEYGLEKALNEAVYVIKKAKGKDWVVISALDPQGGCFTRNPEQIIKIGEVSNKKFKEFKTVKKSIDWMKELEKVLKIL